MSMFTGVYTTLKTSEKCCVNFHKKISYYLSKEKVQQNSQVDEIFFFNEISFF